MALASRTGAYCTASPSRGREACPYPYLLARCEMPWCCRWACASFKVSRFPIAVGWRLPARAFPSCALDLRLSFPPRAAPPNSTRTNHRAFEQWGATMRGACERLRSGAQEGKRRTICSGKGGPLTPTFAAISTGGEGVIIDYAKYPLPFNPEKGEDHPLSFLGP